MSVYDRLLKPLNNVNANTIYQEKYVGNSPEFIPLDNSLNYDLQLSNMYHCVVTAHLPDTNLNNERLSMELKFLTYGIILCALMLKPGINSERRM